MFYYVKGLLWQVFCFVWNPFRKAPTSGELSATLTERAYFYRFLAKGAIAPLSHTPLVISFRKRNNIRKFIIERNLLISASFPASFPFVSLGFFLQGFICVFSLTFGSLIIYSLCRYQNLCLVWNSCQSAPLCKGSAVTNGEGLFLFQISIVFAKGAIAPLSHTPLVCSLYQCQKFYVGWNPCFSRYDVGFVPYG